MDALTYLALVFPGFSFYMKNIFKSYMSSVSVWIKLSSAVEDEFVHVSCHPSTYIADVAALACSACPSWQLKANRVRIYLIAKAGEAKPNQKKIDEVIKLLKAEETKLLKTLVF